jgi:NADPH:quinone reductase
VPKQAGSGSKSRVPAMMRAAAIDRFGGPEAITTHILPVPEVVGNEVLIQIHAAGVGIWDAEVRNGSWRPFGRVKFPLVLGTDGAGVVVAKGSRARKFEIGDRIWAYDYANPKGGFYAEYVAINADHVGFIPDGLDLLEAGAAATTGLTAQQGIDDHLKIRSKDTLLIFGATGAVGTLAIQFAKRHGAHVIATASGRDGAKLVQRLGADDVLDSRSDDALEQLAMAAPKGLNALLALAGGESLNRMLESVRPGGRVAFPHGIEPEPRRRRSYQSIGYDATPGARQFGRLKRASEEAGLQVPIAATFPLTQAAKAHRRLEQGHVLGRIALRIQPEGRSRSRR